MNDEKFKLALAKMLPEKIKEGNASKTGFWLCSPDCNNWHELLETEWLHVCWLVEQTLTHNEWRIYLGFVMGARIIPKLASMEEFHEAWKASWQQRATALAKVKGIEV